MSLENGNCGKQRQESLKTDAYVNHLPPKAQHLVPTSNGLVWSDRITSHKTTDGGREVVYALHAMATTVNNLGCRLHKAK